MTRDKTNGRGGLEEQYISRTNLANNGKSNPGGQCPEQNKNRPVRGWSEWEKTFDAVSDSILIINHDFKITQANIAVTRLLERPLDEIIGRTCWEVVHNMRKPPSQCPLKKACKSKQHEETELYVPEKRLWLHVSVSPILDESGNFNSAVHIIRDITRQKQAEQVILKERDRAQKYLDVAAVIMIAIDSEQRIGLINKKGCEILGYDENEVLGRNWFDNFVPKRFCDEIKSLFKEIMSGRADCPEYHEYPVLTRDGDERLIAWHCTVLRDDKNRIYATLNSGEDITERRQTENALHMSEEKYRKLFENVVVGVGISSISGRVLAMNKAMMDITGFSFKDLSEINLVNTYVNPEDRKSFLEIMNRDGVVENFEVQLMNKAGKPYWASLSSRPIVYDGEDAFLTTLLNITERKQTGEALQESEAMFRAVAALSPAAIAILKSDEQGERFLYVNAAWEVLTGYLQADARRLKPKELTHPDMRTLVEQRAAARIRGEDVPSRYENKIITKDGETKWLDFAATVIRYQDEPALLTVSLDITERKKAEQKLLEERIMLKSMASELTLAEERERQRIATYLHDHIAQNLAMSKFWLQQVQQLHTDETLKDKLSEVLKVLDEVIDSTRSVTFNLSPPTLFEQGLEAALTELLVSEIERKHGIKTEFEDDGQSKPLDEEIRILLYRDVRELLINVVKHAHATKVKVSVSRVGERIRVCVEDDGVGFETEDVEQNALRKHGFGLFSIRQRLEQLGGKFEIRHEPDHGGIVIIEVPLKSSRK